MKVLVAQSCPTLWDPMDCSLPSSSVHGSLQARILEWAVMPGIEPSSFTSLALTDRFLLLMPPGMVLEKRVWEWMVFPCIHAPHTNTHRKHNHININIYTQDVCVYIYMYIYICIYMYTCIYIHMYMYVCVYMYMYTHIHTCKY